MPVLGHPGVIHHRTRANAPDEARLGNGEGAAGKGDVGGDPFAIDDQAQALQGFDHFDPDWAAGQFHPLHPQLAAGVQAVLHPGPHYAKMRVCDIQMGVDAESSGKEAAPVRRIAVEEIAIVEIAISA